jgi:hypothetical protein
LTMAGTTPKKGSVADPGFSGHAAGSGVIMCPPVCTQHRAPRDSQERALPNLNQRRLRPRLSYHQAAGACIQRNCFVASAG